MLGAAAPAHSLRISPVAKKIPICRRDAAWLRVRLCMPVSGAGTLVIGTGGAPPSMAMKAEPPTIGASWVVMP